MKTYRRNGELTIDLLPNNGYSVKMIRAYLEKKDELFSTFQYGKYLVTINQSKAVDLCQIPDLKHEDVLIFSLDEARPLLKHLGWSDSGFFGKIVYRHNKAGNFTPMIVIDFDRIARSIKRRGVRSIKNEVLDTFAHEVRHAEQHQRNFPQLKGFWKFAESYRRKKQQFSTKKLSIISVITGLLLGSLWLSPGHILFLVGIGLLSNLFLLDMFITIRDPIEEDARKFAHKAVRDKRWRKCVKVEKIIKNKIKKEL